MSERTYETLLVERDGAVMTVRLNRPEKRNAVNRRMHLDLQRLCRELAEDFETRVVIFAGQGSGFSSGADTSEWGRPGPDNELELRHASAIGGRTSDAIDGLDQITIAAVHGFAVGGGAVIALCCDFRVVGESTWFSIPEVELGIPLSWNALPRLAREVGYARALELTIVCERFNARQAHEWGLVTHLVPDGDERSFAQELAAKVVAKPPLPVALTKAEIRRSSAARKGATSPIAMAIFSSTAVSCNSGRGDELKSAASRNSRGLRNKQLASGRRITAPARCGGQAHRGRRLHQGRRVYN